MLFQDRTRAAEGQLHAVVGDHGRGTGCRGNQPALSPLRVAHGAADADQGPDGSVLADEAEPLHDALGRGIVRRLGPQEAKNGLVGPAKGAQKARLANRRTGGPAPREEPVDSALRLALFPGAPHGEARIRRGALRLPIAPGETLSSTPRRRVCAYRGPPTVRS